LYSSVGIATGYGLDDRGLNAGRGKSFSLLHSIQAGSGAHPALVPMGTECRGVKLIIHLHIVLKSRMVELYLHSNIHLHGVVIN
jgi:hypothetical protein